MRSTPRYSTLEEDRLLSNKMLPAGVSEDTETLSEIMLAADRFCSEIEARNKDIAPNSEEKELQAKLGLCRTQLAYLQNIFDEDRLKLEDPLVREGFRHLIIALMWITFYSRGFIDFRLFRKLVLIESVFSYSLIHQRDGDETTGPTSVPASVSAIAPVGNHMSPAISGRSPDATAKTRRQKYILLWATLCLLILNLIVAIVGPKWKQHRLETVPRNEQKERAKQ